MPLLLSQSEMLLATNTDPRERKLDTAKKPHMAVQALHTSSQEVTTETPHIDLSYDHENSDASTKRLIYRVRPEWETYADQLETTKFTDGITNTLLRVARRRPGATQEEVDHDSVLLRAYGNNTDLIIDRDREARSHALLAERGMAPPLLARFNNGLLYEYIPGKVCTPEDLTREPVWRGVAIKLGEWHARVPISAVTSKPQNHSNGLNGHCNGYTNGTNGNHVTNGRPGRLIEGRAPEPNIWSVLQKWVDIIPAETEKEKARKELLQHEIERTFQELDSLQGIGERGFVFGHLDLLSANVIMLPTKPDATLAQTAALPITFIDYEYATPCPALFDIANHFAEWAGYDLDYNRLPTRSVRKAFLAEYLGSYNQHASTRVEESILDSLAESVNHWRGIPGLYWGIWALIQAKISQIDFDYATYAEDRLNEYWAWRAETSGSRIRDGKPMPLREQRWAQEG